MRNVSIFRAFPTSHVKKECQGLERFVWVWKYRLAERLITTISSERMRVLKDS